MNVTMWEALLWVALGGAVWDVPQLVRGWLQDRRFRRRVMQDELLNPRKEDR